jgi:hypothetical protein
MAQDATMISAHWLAMDGLIAWGGVLTIESPVGGSP